MRIVIDGFGGDNSPNETVLGACLAIEKNADIEIIITGNEEKIKQVLSKNNICQPNRLKIVHASEIIENEDDPIAAVKTKKESSLAIGLKLVSNGDADAIVSAGNTGALLTGATLIIKRIKGIKRAALAPIVPTLTGSSIIVDVGANAECKPEFFPQFGIMGSIYASEILGIKNPKVGLINIGVEEHKGTETVLSAHHLLKETKNISFIGNIEARDLLNGQADVLVSDGWTGNIALKTIEGTASALMKLLKGVFYKNIFTKLATLVLKNGLTDFKKKFDHEEAGGAPLLGLNAPVIKAHGSAGRLAFANAILFANSFCEKEVCRIISEKVAEAGSTLND